MFAYSYVWNIKIQNYYYCQCNVETWQKYLLFAAISVSDTIDV